MPTIDVPLHHHRRIVLVRFERAIDSGDPDPNYPDIDLRGERPAELGGIVGVMQGRTVEVKAVRMQTRRSRLFAVSSRPDVFRVEDPAELPDDWRPNIRITGVSGGADSQDARLEIHIGAVDGPIVGFLTVRVYVERNVDITPHRVQLVRHHHGATHPGAVPIANIAQIMEKVRAVWIHYGVTFDVAAEGAVEQVRVANETRVSDDPYPGELARVARSNWVPSTINVYFVDRIGTGETLGYGFSRSSFSANGMPHPCILLADRTGSARAGLMHWANDLAHEIGHFFRLWHVGRREPPREIETSWARRQLMHNFNQTRSPTWWPASMADGTRYRSRPLFDDVGYGTDNRGCLVTMKSLPNVLADNQAGTVRATLGSPAGPY